MDLIYPNKDNMNAVSPLWAFANEVRELIKDTPDVEVGLDELNRTVIVKTKDEKRWNALRAVLPETVEFNEGVLTIKVVLDHFGGPDYLRECLLEAFKGNPHFNYMHWWEDPTTQTSPYCWVNLKQDFAEYPESNLHQLYGYTIKPYATLAQDVLAKKTNCIFYDVDAVQHGCPIPETNSALFH